jgi:hypothetical protein
MMWAPKPPSALPWGRSIGLLAALLLFAGLAPAQILEPHRPKIGMSVGALGMHLVFKPSFDFHYRGFSARAAPGLFYISGGISQRIGYYRPRHRQDRQLYVHFYYHDDWLLSRTRRSVLSREFKRDQDIYMLMLGIRYRMEPLNRIYFEFNVGAMYLVEHYNPVREEPVPSRHYVYPMLEVRIGGIFFTHRVHHQYLPGQEKLRRQRLNPFRKRTREIRGRGANVGAGAPSSAPTGP